jgi:hypothetical protein
MTLEDEHLADLVKTLAAAHRHYIAVSLANSLKSVNTAAGTTVHELGEAEAAEVAWKAAEKALMDYQASERWTHDRD